MRREKVILTSVPVKQAGQVCLFEVKIPRDAKRIIGIETGLIAPDLNKQMKDAFQFLQDNFLGDLRLQSCEDTNIFFSAHIYQTDNNVGFGDVVGLYSDLARLPEIFGYKREEFVINTNGTTTILKGIYRDRQIAQTTSPTIAPIGNSPPQPVLPTNANAMPLYIVNVYVWYELINDET